MQVGKLSQGPLDGARRTPSPNLSQELRAAEPRRGKDDLQATQHSRFSVDQVKNYPSRKSRLSSSSRADTDSAQLAPTLSFVNKLAPR